MQNALDDEFVRHLIVEPRLFRVVWPTVAEETLQGEEHRYFYGRCQHWHRPPVSVWDMADACAMWPALKSWILQKQDEAISLGLPTKLAVRDQLGMPIATRAVCQLLLAREGERIISDTWAANPPNQGTGDGGAVDAEMIRRLQIISGRKREAGRLNGILLRTSSVR